MPKKINGNWDLVAPCGLCCRECTGFLDAKCGGCRSNQGLSKEFRKYCRIYKCSENKGLKLCLDCNDFPCRFFEFFGFPGGYWFLDNLNNMRQIKKQGIVKFLEMELKWLEGRKECAKEKGINRCDVCGQRPCKLYGARLILVPVDLNDFKEFMEGV